MDIENEDLLHKLFLTICIESAKNQNKPQRHISPPLPADKSTLKLPGEKSWCVSYIQSSLVDPMWNRAKQKVTKT